jgi:hypothetical protein
MANKGEVVAHWYSSAPDCCPAVLEPNSASVQSAAHRQFLAGLQPKLNRARILKHFEMPAGLKV